jgi:hypothetical protein
MADHLTGVALKSCLHPNLKEKKKEKKKKKSLTVTNKNKDENCCSNIIRF